MKGGPSHHGPMELDGPFSMGLYWLRARKRRRDGWFYLALLMEFLPVAGALYAAAFVPEWRGPGLVALAVGIVALWLLRDYLPWWPRSRTERALDAALDLPPLPAVEGQVPTPPNTLLDPLDAISGQGRWAVVDGHATGELRWRVEPDPTVARLRRATAIAMRSAKRACRTGDRLKVSGDLRRVPGPDLVRVGLVLRGPGVGREQMRAVEASFEAAFREALAAHHRVERA